VVSLVEIDTISLVFKVLPDGRMDGTAQADEFHQATGPEIGCFRALHKAGVAKHSRPSEGIARWNG